ncbi:MAG: hypothetical protein IE914_06115 [Thiotrichales bacterium]|nr:hypothetical protein [Thiotrichales bacterium]
MSFVYCDVYQCPSASGGKVWAVPKNDIKVLFTFSGTLSRYRNGSTTVNELKAKKWATDLINDKRNKGYSWMQSIWIDIQSGQVSKTNPDNPTATGLEQAPVAPEPLLPTIEVKGEGLFNF